MKVDTSKALVIVLIVVGFLVLGGGGYFTLIRSQHAKAADLDKQIADTSQSIDSARALTLQAKQAAQIRVADLFRLTKAMPDQTNMADIVLELNNVAEQSGITFESIAPSTTAVALDGYEAIPITLEFQGNFYELADFLYRLRNLVDVRHGALAANGRLFAVDTIDYGEAPPPASFPAIRAHLVIDAFVFGTGVAPTVPAPSAGATGSTGATARPAPRARPARPERPGPPAPRPQEGAEHGKEEVRCAGQGQAPEDHRRGRRRDPARGARLPGAAHAQAAASVERERHVGACGHDPGDRSDRHGRPANARRRQRNPDRVGHVGRRDH